MEVAHFAKARCYNILYLKRGTGHRHFFIQLATNVFIKAQWQVDTILPLTPNLSKYFGKLF